MLNTNIKLFLKEKHSNYRFARLRKICVGQQSHYRYSPVATNVATDIIMAKLFRIRFRLNLFLNFNYTLMTNYGFIRHTRYDIIILEIRVICDTYNQFI